MNNNLMKICYQGETGESDIRTIIISDILYISLRDILTTLNKENREINAHYATKSMIGIIRAQLEALDSDEYKMINIEYNSTFEGEKEVFVTQPGLYRVMSSDRSAAGKRFQKWLFHEVIPSLTKHGVYPPPSSGKGSALAKMAEIVAQNSRMIADTIILQEKLAEDFYLVKGKIDSMETRVEHLEFQTIYNDNEMQTLKERLSFFDIRLNEKDFKETLAWCENITFLQGRKKIYATDRDKTLFSIQTIDDAISIMRDKEKINN
ncbi:conserved hypothetical protein [Xenorhabdus bovienii str. puntauvense]|uniref:Bro-N domain-containing protein n=1 Tax=Xenorhabdus bovienii str. puntauvense TaxID=1398201 RepID=A0A077NC82_XENBV|nr:BRO family protein [Xenorhabdus bovienii]CDG95822.1 conserved hypothetical protein [Xenorhabdus bovienii str. puntauvense]